MSANSTPRTLIMITASVAAPSTNGGSVTAILAFGSLATAARPISLSSANLAVRSILGTATTRQLVSHIARVRAHISWDGHWHIHILRARSSHWATLLIAALVPSPQPVQLALPFARLHKT